MCNPACMHENELPTFLHFNVSFKGLVGLDVSQLAQCEADRLKDLTLSFPRKILACKTEETALRPRPSTEHEPVVIKNKELADLSSYRTCVSEGAFNNPDTTLEHRQRF